MRWVQVTPGVTLKSYTFFISLNLSRSNSQKNTLINANIQIDLIYYPLFNIFCKVEFNQPCVGFIPCQICLYFSM